MSNRRVFCFFLNVAKFSVTLISGDRLFQMSGPVTENVLWPNWVLVRFTTAARVVDDRRRRTAVSLSLNVTMSIRYARQQRCRQRCISVASLNKTLYLTGSQCSRFSAGVMCARRSRPSTNRVLVAVVSATTLVGRRVRRCSSQCEWWPVNDSTNRTITSRST